MYRTSLSVLEILLAVAVCFAAGCGPAAPTDDQAPGLVDNQQHSAPATLEQEAPSVDLSAWDAAGDQADGPFNVVWVTFDACRRRSMSCYGYDRKTSPNLDAIAAHGVLFEDAFTQAYKTVPSVPSYLSGRFFAVHRQSQGNWRELWRTPPPEEKLISEILSGAGYRTAIFTAHPDWGPESRLGKSFDECFYLPSIPHPTFEGQTLRAPFENVNESVFPWLDAHKDENFFLYVHTMDTHFAHVLEPPHDKWLDRSIPEAAEIDAIWSQERRYEFGPRAQEYLRGLHDGSIHYADAQLAALVNKLADLDLLGKTILVFNSDHGEVLGEDGMTIGHPEFEFSDQVMEIPLIIAGPGIPQGRRVEALVQNADMVPTLVELLGVDSEATFDGKSLLGLMNDPTAPPLHKYVFYRYRAHMTFGQPGMVLRDTQYKYNFMPGEGSPTGEDEENLWTAPDNIESRQEVTAQYPEVLAGMRQYLQENIMPKWKAFEELPYTTPAPFYEGLPGQGEPEDAYVSRIAHSMMDNRWTLDASTLESAGWREDAPPITLRLEVPNETYQVFMQIRSIADLGGHPASAFRYRAQGDTEFKTIIADDGTGEYKLIDIGTYTVDSGSFVITLDEGSPTHWALAKEFRFVPVALIEESLSTEEEMERAEQIRALGYVE